MCQLNLVLLFRLPSVNAILSRFGAYDPPILQHRSPDTHPSHPGTAIQGTKSILQYSWC